MFARVVLWVSLLSTVGLGCAVAGPPYIDQMRPAAVDMAVRRGAFEMNCPSAKGEELSDEMVPPLVSAFAWTGPERAEYTVGVSGCGKRTLYQVICPDNGSRTCFAGGSRTQVQDD